MNIVIQGASKLSGSYGRVNVHLGLALSRCGHRVRLEPWDQAPETCVASLASDGIAFGDFFAVSQEPPDRAEVTIRQIWPPVWTPPVAGSRLVVIQPWEYGSLPLSWLPGIAATDAIWVPSTAVKAGYVQSGVSPEKVWVVPNGTDLLLASDADLTPGRRDPLSLLFLGGGIYRKGPDLLIGALEQLEDDALGRIQLTIKETGAGSYYRGQSIVDQALAEAPRVAARTTVLRTDLDRRELAQLMGRHHVLVHPYRAEGFALPVLEAMGCGLPVLVPRGGATDDFCRDGEALFIASQLRRWPTPYVDDLLTVDFPYHREPDVTQLRDMLLALVDGGTDLTAVRDAASARARSLSWDHVARMAQTALDQLLAGEGQRDPYHEAHAAVHRVVGEPSTPAWIDAVRRLLAVGDIQSGIRLLELTRLQQPDDQNVAHTLRRLESLAETQPDLWSAAPWRLELVAALRDDAEVPNIVHRHEGTHDAVAQVARALAPYFSSCRTVLDLGCGQGAMMRTLRAQGKQVLGIEGDPGLVARLRAEGFSVTHGWIPDDLDALSDLQVDGIFMGHIIEHLAPERALDVLRWAAAHLNDEGTLVIQTPDFSQDFVSGSNFWLDPTHVRPYPIALLAGMLESVGLAPLAGGCRSLAPHAPLDLIAVGRRHRQRSTGARRKAPPPSSTRLLHFGLFGSDTGMGRAGRGLLDRERLTAQGVETIRVDLEAPGGSDPPLGTIPFAEALSVAGDLAVVDVPIGWLPEVLPAVRAEQRVVRLAYEADPLPRYLVEALASVEEVWVMSRYVERVAVAGGCDPARMVLVSPMVPVEPHAEASFAGAGEERRPTIFSSVFSFEPRKNPEALLRAYATLHSRGHDVALMLKTSGMSAEQFWQWASAVLGVDATEAIRPTVQLHTSHLDDAQLHSLLAHSDAFVLPTRGEGFGLPFLEAMAAGVPVICPDIGGHRDFCDEETSFLVPTTSVPCAAAWSIPVFHESRWREVVFDELVAAMTRVVTDPEHVRKKAVASLNRARDRAEVDQRRIAERHAMALLARRERRPRSSPATAE